MRDRCTGSDIGAGRRKSSSWTAEAPSGITLGNAPMFVDLKFSGRRLFWLRAIIRYMRVDSRGPNGYAMEEERESAPEGSWNRVRHPSCPSGHTGGTLNRITIRHGDVIHLHYYFSRERP